MLPQSNKEVLYLKELLMLNSNSFNFESVDRVSYIGNASPTPGQILLHRIDKILGILEKKLNF